jgi:ssDNA-binding Zn-finger/Zn-ribbon topoisomerase 1
MSEGKEKKLTILADQYGLSVGELLEEWALDSVVPGICMNPDCEYTAEYEPDQREGWCEACGTQSVTSFLILLGVI